MTVIFTDPHLGGKRAANTTPASRARMQSNVFTTVEQLIGSTHLEEPIFCLGDLFDSYSNSEMTLIRSLPIVKRLNLCLAGNHDMVSDNVKTGSLELLMQLKDCKDTHFAYLNFDEIGFDSSTVDNTKYFSVPHISDQTKFEMSLSEVLAAAQDDPSKHKYLFLHCNYDNPFCDETSLNLTKENTEELLQVFDTIVLGHEHSHRVDFGGRLVVLGNTYPTAFGDVCDKFTMWVNDTTGEYQLRCHWRAATHYWEVDWKDALIKNYDEKGLLTDDLQYVKLTGKVAPSDTKQFSLNMKSLWANLSDVCAIKSEVDFEGVAAASLEKGSLDRLPEIIAKELAGTEFEELWKELSNAD